MKKILALLAFLVLQGCATQTTLYEWGNYESAVYKHFNNESPEEQIKILEKDLTAAGKSGKPLPPGFYAHLALLYGKVGQPGKMNEMLALEASAFPEAVPFLKNLRSGFKATN